MAIDIAALEEQAAKIPSMGGQRLGPTLRKAVAKASPGTVIVEVGSWLGSGTAQLAIGLVEAGLDIPLHCFDRWEATKNEVVKAQDKKGLSLERGQDTLPIVQEYLSGIPADIHFHKGEIVDITWSGPEISVYVDDAAKSPEHFQHVLRTFGPSWIPNKTELFLMDYGMWRRFPEMPKLKCQHDFVQGNPDSFELVEADVTGLSASHFLYLGGIDFETVEL